MILIGGGLPDISDEYKRLLDNLNYAKTTEDHDHHRAILDGYRLGLEACGYSANRCGCDMYYINQGLDWPMCCGERLDWKPEGE